MTAAELARHEALAIARAIVATGGTATLAEIANQTKLPHLFIARRLIANGPSNVNAKFSYFTGNRDTGFGLSSYGREFLETAHASAVS